MPGEEEMESCWTGRVLGLQDEKSSGDQLYNMSVFNTVELCT